jgi:predicted ATPase
MPALVELDAQNFRSLQDVKVRLGGFNVLVGPNGSGKSNLLDLIRFIGDSVRSDLGPALEIRGGFNEVCFRGAKAKHIRIGVVTNVTSYSSSNALDEYTLDFRLARLRRRTPGAPPDYVLVRDESFRFKRTKSQGRRITIQGSRVDIVDTQPGGKERTASRDLLRKDSLALATLPRLSDEAGGTQIRQIAELFSSFRVFDIDVTAAREPSLLASRTELAPNARNLAAFLLYLRDDCEADQYSRLLEDARAFVPGLRELHFVAVGGADEAVALELEEDELPGRTKLADASFGTIRALALLALLYDPHPPDLTCIEEIDHGLHPYVFDRLTDRLREASSRTQLIIATHSPAFVNRLQPQELIVCERDRETGASLIPAIDVAEAEAVAASADQLGLGELWFSGTLGGVPTP